MRVLVLGAAGVLAVILLVMHSDISALGRALGAVGASGLAAIVGLNFLPSLLSAMGWRCLLAGKPGIPTFLWLRYTRNAATDLLGIVPGSGEFIALREMIRYGIERNLAAGVLIADLTLQLVAQLGFALVGLSLLLAISPDSKLLRVSLTGFALLIAILAAFAALQRWGVGRVMAAFARRILPKAALTSPATIGELSARLRKTYADRRRVTASTALHLAAWFLGIGEAGLALSLMGAWPGVEVLLVVESLVFALRTSAFFIPGAWGVQEATYVLVGSSFGLAPETMLAVTLVKRARELTVGLPILFVGQVLPLLRPRTAIDRLRSRNPGERWGRACVPPDA